MADVIGMTKWLSTQLKEYELDTLMTDYAELWGYEGENVSARADLKLGLRSIVHSRMDYTGRAVNLPYGGKANNLPLVNYGITLESKKTAVGIAAAEWNFFDLESEKVAADFPQLLQSRDLVASYMAALDKSLREWMHLKVWAGDRSLGMVGLFNDPYVTVTAESQNLNTMTAGDLYTYFLGRIAAFKKRNKLINNNISILASTDLITSLSKRYGDGSSDGTPLKQIRDLFVNITEINELSAAYLEEFGVTNVGTNKDLLVLYENNPDTVDRRFTPIQYTDVGLLDDQLTFRVVGFCATTEVRVKKPMNMEYIQYPKAA